MKPRTGDPKLGASVFEALPCPALLVDAAYKIVQSNAMAREVLRPRPGAALGDALGCARRRARSGQRGEGTRSAGCVFREAAARALAGEATRARGFVIRTDPGGTPADLHLLALASPLVVRGARHAILLFVDLNQILADPAIVHVCAACGRVEDEEGDWYPLHRFLEDRLGLEASEELCTDCARAGGPRGP